MSSLKSCFNIAIVYFKTTQYPANLNKCLQQEYQVNVWKIIFFSCEERLNSYIQLYSSPSKGMLWSPEVTSSQLGRALHWSDITEVMGLNPVQAWIFFRLYGNFMTARVVCLHTHHSMLCWQSHTDCILLCTSGQEIKMKSTKWTFSN